MIDVLRCTLKVFQSISRPKIYFRVRIRSIASFSVSDSFWSRKTNDQVRTTKFIWSTFKQLRIDYFDPKLVYRVLLDNRIIFRKGLFLIKRNRWSRLEEKSKPESFIDTYNRFSYPKFVHRVKIRSFASFSVSDIFLITKSQTSRMDESH